MKLSFDPVKNGWHFPAADIAEAMGVKRSNGLCGGMSLSAVNYFRYGMNIPALTVSDFTKTGKIAEAPAKNPVLDFILYSQFAVFESPAILKHKTEDIFLNNTESHHLDSVDNEFPKIKKALDEGCFVILGLRSLNQGYKACQQTLVYGYDDRNYTLYMYDSNNPNEEVMVKSNGNRLVFSNGEKYCSYYMLMALNPSIHSDLNTYDPLKNLACNFSVKPPQA